VLGTDSERKREAIARAALTLFVSDGYERTSVDAIAAEAGVSKRTIYSHYDDKETLFLSVVRDTYEAMLARIAEIIDRVPWDDDLAVALTTCVTDITRSVVRAPERATLTRLLITEAPHFPAVIDLLRTREVAPLLAAPLERLAAAGRLHLTDGKQAAEHLVTLTFGQVSARSLLGTVPLSEEETARLIKGGVQVFIRAYVILSPPTLTGPPTLTARPPVAAPRSSSSAA
jgi:TetR/AcrR family transcriptional regulator, mexJK operon transcriptional repressor